METKKKKLVYAVLTPHKDIRSALQKCSNSFIEAGLKGVYPFPLVSPLAQLSGALNDDELKLLAKSLRLVTGKNKLYIREISVTEFNGAGMTLFGPRLEFPNKDTERISYKETEYTLSLCSEKIISIFNPLLIGAYLIPKDNAQFAAQAPSLLSDFLKNIDEKIDLSFRAAAVANMFWQPVNENPQIEQRTETFFKWKIGKLCWLPHPEKIKNLCYNKSKF